MLLADFACRMHLVSGGNVREHHFARKKRVDNERGRVYAMWQQLRTTRAIPEQPQPPLEVLLRRVIGPRGQSMDDANLPGALKTVQDTMAALLMGRDPGKKVGRGDGPKDFHLISWTMGEERGQFFGVHVQVYQRPADDPGHPLRIVRPEPMKRARAAGTLELPLAGGTR